MRTKKFCQGKRGWCFEEDAVEGESVFEAV
jgi:hypothetical protein